MAFELLSDRDGSAVVRVSGELDMTTVPTLERGVAPVMGRTPDRLVLDLGALQFADSSAIALFVRWANTVGHIELRQPSPVLWRVIVRMGLAEHLGVTP